jgi:hypothetical protein
VRTGHCSAAAVQSAQPPQRQGSAGGQVQVREWSPVGRRLGAAACSSAPAWLQLLVAAAQQHEELAPTGNAHAYVDVKACFWLASWCAASRCSAQFAGGSFCGDNRGIGNYGPSVLLHDFEHVCDPVSLVRVLAHGPFGCCCAAWSQASDPLSSAPAVLAFTLLALPCSVMLFTVFMCLGRK